MILRLLLMVELSANMVWAGKTLQSTKDRFKSDTGTKLVYHLSTVFGIRYTFRNFQEPIIMGNRVKLLNVIQMLSAPLGDLQVHRSEKHIFVKLQNKIIILKMSPLRLYTLGQIRGLTSRHRRAQCTKRTPSAQSTSRSAKKGFSLHNVHLSEDEFLSFPHGVLSKV